MSANGRTIVLIGPGGVGKGTVARRLVQRHGSLWLSRSWTTRTRRPHETDAEYRFVTREEFERAISDGEFLEWAEFNGHLYGTPRPQPPADHDVLLEIEVQGAAQVLALDPDAEVILLVPPSPEKLAERLVGRGDGVEHVAQRLRLMPEELSVGRQLAAHEIVNDDVERAVDEILSILEQPHRDR